MVRRVVLDNIAYFVLHSMHFFLYIYYIYSDFHQLSEIDWLINKFKVENWTNPLTQSESVRQKLNWSKFLYTKLINQSQIKRSRKNFDAHLQMAYEPEAHLILPTIVREEYSVQGSGCRTWNAPKRCIHNEIKRQLSKLYLL